MQHRQTGGLSESHAAGAALGDQQVRCDIRHASEQRFSNGQREVARPRFHTESPGHPTTSRREVDDS